MKTFEERAEEIYGKIVFGRSGVGYLVEVLKEQDRITRQACIKDLKKLPLTEDKYTGLHVRRLEFNNPREVTFSEQWRKYNKQHMSGSRGIDFLQILMSEESDELKEGYTTNQFDYTGLPFIKFHEISDETKLAVSTFVQWLGSNNGMEFIESALDRCGYEIKRIKL